MGGERGGDASMGGMSKGEKDMEIKR